MKYMKDSNRKQFVDNRDMLRLVEEHQEAARRREIINQGMDEEKGNRVFKEAIEKIANEAPTEKEFYQFKRDFAELREFFWTI